MTESLLLEPD